MPRAFIAALFAVLACAAARAESDKTPQVLGMPLVTLDGPYQYISGGVRVKGYIVAQPVGASPNLTTAAADALIDFQLCDSDEKIKVKRDQLKKSSPCRTTGPSPWVAWIVKNGSLVAKGPSGTSVPVGALPPEWQSIIKQGDTNEIRALSLPSVSGPDTLAIIVNPRMS